MRDFVGAEGGIAVGSAGSVGEFNLWIFGLAGADEVLSARGGSDHESESDVVRDSVCSLKFESRLLLSCAVEYRAIPFEGRKSEERDVDCGEREHRVGSGFCEEHEVLWEILAAHHLNFHDTGESIDCHIERGDEGFGRFGRFGRFGQNQRFSQRDLTLFNYGCEVIEASRRRLKVCRIASQFLGSLSMPCFSMKAYMISVITTSCE